MWSYNKQTNKPILSFLLSATYILFIFKVSHIGVVPEILRGIRTHFAKLVKGLTEKNSSKAQLGLGHSYSRAKVKFNVNKSDNMIIQVIILCFIACIMKWYETLNYSYSLLNS